MNYEEFAEMVQIEMRTIFREEAEVEFHRMNRNNGQSRDALCVVYRDRDVSPVIYLQPFYQQHLQGRGIVDILTDMSQMAQNSRDACFPVEEMSDWSYVRSRICGKIIGLRDNQEYLKTVPHRICMDMALVYYMLFEDTDAPAGCVVVTQEHMEMWERTEEDLYRASSGNLPRLLPAGAYCMEAMLDEMLSGGSKASPNLLDEGTRLEPDHRTGLYVITNDHRWLGAVALFYDRVLDTLMDRLELEEAFIIPSSIHEMILVPGDVGDADRLQQMVADVNDTSVEAEERLTYSVYRYHRRDQRLTCLNHKYACSTRIYGLCAA